MAHNFKLTGNYYVSVDGSDSNDGLTPDTPKRTIQAGLNLMTSGQKTLIIGTGTYNETLTQTLVANSGSIIRGDGIVVLDGSQGKTITFNCVLSNSSGYQFYNIIFCRYATLNFAPHTITLGLGYSLFSGCIILCPITLLALATNIPTIRFTRCLLFFELSNYVAFTVQMYFEYSILVNFKINLYSSTDCNATACLNSFISTTSVFRANSAIIAANFNYNNIQGSIIMNVATGVTTGTYQDIYGRYYDLSQAGSGGSGTLIDPYKRSDTSGKAFSYTNHRILYPTFNANSISTDPKFNAITAQDFTLQADSPHIGRASDGISNIGGTNYAIRDAANGDVFYTSAVSRTNLAFLGNDQIVSGGTSGEVISAPRFVSNIPKVLQKISYVGLLEFNKSVTGGTTGNKNVPDQEVYDSTTQPPNVAGANPDRLVYYMRFSTQVAQPASDSEWDNGGLWTAGNYETFEWNTKPSVDNVGVGNGSPSFNAAATPVYLNATWIQMKVKLRNDYV